MKNESSAAKLKGQIDANMEAYFSSAIDYPTFHANQRRLWDEIQTDARTNAAVLRRIRHDITGAAR